MSDAHLQHYLARFADHRVAVVGDLMLDRYVWGAASRISEEAPVPVVTIRDETQSPGGAANVVNNILCLGGNAMCYGIVGDDSQGRRLLSLLDGLGADIGGIRTLRNRPTTVKTRVIANHQQVVRIDAETTTPIDRGVIRDLQGRLLRDLRTHCFDAIVFEDYAKGLLTPEFIQAVVDAANQAGLMTALDPHPSHNFNVHGLTAMTPNRSEAFGLAGMYHTPGILPLNQDHALVEVGQRLCETWRTACLLITLGAHGMALFTDQSTTPLHIPTRAMDVYDVSGAGDTVTASFTLGMLSGASAADAAALANHAAGIVVGKVGTLPVHLSELRENLRNASSAADGHESGCGQ